MSSQRQCFLNHLHQCLLIQREASPDPSEFPGDDGKGPYGAGGLQVQGCQEAVRGLAAAASLQGLAQAAPRFVRGAVDLNRITKDLLPEVGASRFDQQTALHEQREGFNALKGEVIKQT